MRKAVVFVLAFLIVVIFSLSSVFAREDLFEKGRRAYLKKDFRNAVKYLNEYVASNPDPYAYYLLGYANYELKRKGPAKGRKDFWGDTRTREYFKEAYLIDPSVSPGPASVRRK